MFQIRIPQIRTLKAALSLKGQKPSSPENDWQERDRHEKNWQEAEEPPHPEPSQSPARKPEKASKPQKSANPDKAAARSKNSKTGPHLVSGMAVNFRSVGLRYGNGPEILRDISFTLEPGSFHFLTGPSGAGKTSLLSLLYLAQRPTRGSVELFGQDVTIAPRRSLPALRRRLGVVFQEFRLLDHLSAWDNVALPLRVAGASESEINACVTELLMWVGLENHQHAKPPILSGGQKQRVAIARAVINSPDLLVADEPTGNVDDATAYRLMNLFRVMNRQGTTIVIATHNEQLVRQMRQPRLHLENGQLSLHSPEPPPSGGSPSPRSARPPAASLD